MAWFNRTNIEFTDEELQWITENASASSKADSTKFFTEDKRPLFYAIEISNLPREAEADELTLRRMLSSRLNN